MSSANLDFDSVVEGQQSAEVTINDAFGQVDAALTDVFEIEVTNTNIATVTEANFQRHIMFQIVPGTPSPTATITFTVPNTVRGIFVVLNESGEDVEVEISGQSEDPATVGNGDASTLYSDGVNVRAVGGGGSGPLVSPVTITNGVENLVITVASLFLTTFSTDSIALEWEVDADGSPASVGLTATTFSPGTNDTMDLGSNSLRWNQLFVGTGTSDFQGHVGIDNQMELRLYELDANGANYSSFKAAALMGGTVNYTLPDAAPTANASVLASTTAGVMSWDAPPYDFVGFFAGAPTAGELVTRIVADRSITMPTSLTGSQGYLGTPATAQTDFDLQKNGVSVGTMRFAAAGQVATFIFASPVSLVAGDLFAIVAPNPADATAANLSYALKNTRTN